MTASLSSFDRRLLENEIISRQMRAGFVMRPLEDTDYDKGYLQVLSHLTVVGDMTKGQFLQIFHHHRQFRGTYYTIVIERLEDHRIVGCGTLLMERKFIHQGGCVGHLEDVVTSPEVRGFHFGKLIIDGLTALSKRVGAYKTILDCIESNVSFYREKCGFTVKEYQMVVRHSENDVMKSKL